MAILFDARAREILAARYRHWPPSRFRRDYSGSILETELRAAAVPRFICFSFLFFSFFANVSVLYVQDILYYYCYTLCHYIIVDIHYYVIVII